MTRRKKSFTTCAPALTRSASPRSKASSPIPTRPVSSGSSPASPSGRRISSSRSREIKALADLKGKTIGVVSMHEGTTFFVADIARAGGFALGDVKVEAVGGSPTRARLLKERKIDMGLQPYPLCYEAEAEGFSNLGAIAKLVPDYQFTSVVVDETWARANRVVLVAFLRALRRGTDYMFAHPEESAELGAKE